jgi:hypothetical protein
MKNNIINFILFQSVWFVLILSAAHLSYYGMTLGILLIILQLLLAGNTPNDWLIGLLALAAGFIHDSLLNYFNFISYNLVFIDKFSPIWIVGLWVSFALTINHSLSWLKNKVVLQVFFGGIGGPLAYLAGQKLGAIELTSDNTPYILIVSWAILTPLIFFFSNKR